MTHLRVSALTVSNSKKWRNKWPTMKTSKDQRGKKKTKTVTMGRSKRKSKLMKKRWMRGVSMERKTTTLLTRSNNSQNSNKTTK